jgi:hypothetical protein
MYHELFLLGRPDLAEGIHKVGKTKSQPNQLASPSICLALVSLKRDDMLLKDDLDATVSVSVPAPLTIVTAGRALFFQRATHHDGGLADVGWQGRSRFSSDELINLLSGNMINGACEDDEEELPEIDDTSNLLEPFPGQSCVANLVQSEMDGLLDFQAPQDSFILDQDESDMLSSDLLEPTPLSVVYSSVSLSSPSQPWISILDQQEAPIRLSRQSSACSSQAARDMYICCGMDSASIPGLFPAPMRRTHKGPSKKMAKLA